MTLLIFAEWKGENKQGGGGGLKGNMKGRTESCEDSVLHTLPTFDQPQIVNLMIQEGNDDLAQAEMQTCLRMSKTANNQKSQVQFGFILPKILQSPLKMYNGVWEKKGTEIHFSTEERLTASQSALPTLHVMKRSPQDRSGRQAATAAVLCHYNDRFPNLPQLNQQYPNGLACCDGSALLMGICTTKKKIAFCTTACPADITRAEQLKG